MTPEERRRLNRLLAAQIADEAAMRAALQPATDEPVELDELDDTDT